MATENEYRRRIREYDSKGLQELWKSIESGETPGWAPGKAFEYLVLRAFELEGAEVQWPFSVSIRGDEVEQIDGVVYTDGLACLIESKDESERVRIEPIAKLRNQLLRRPSGTLGVVFSRSGFSEPAVTLAHFTLPQVILLWNGDEVAYALQKRYMRSGLVEKFRHCVEHGLPHYHITAEDLP